MTQTRPRQLAYDLDIAAQKLFIAFKHNIADLRQGKMADDEVDFHSKFTVYNERNKELLTIGLTQKKMMMIFLALLTIFFIVLVAFNAIEAKDLVQVKDLLIPLVKDLADQ